jgi:hypothetical protein
VPRGGGEDAAEAGIGGIVGHAPAQHDASADRPVERRPLANPVGHGSIRRVERFDQAEAPRMSLVYVERIAAVEAVHRIGRDEQRAINPDLVHRGDHLIAGDLRRPVKAADPGAAGMIAFVSVHLGIDRRHRLVPPDG